MNWKGKALVIGASKGIGLEVARQLTAQGYQVTATWNSTPPQQREEALLWRPLDMARPAQRAELAAGLEADRFDLVLINAGIFGPAQQSIADVSPEEASSLFMINALAPVQLAQQLIPLLSPENSLLALTSSRLGSLHENPDAEMPLYAASKAALNILSRSLLPQIDAVKSTLLSIHPGWVQTAMGGAAAPVSVTESAAGIVRQMESFRNRGGHHYVDYAGKMLTW